MVLLMTVVSLAKDPPPPKAVTLTWTDFPIDGFPKTPAKLLRNQKQRDALLKAQADFIKQHLGNAKFYGLCEIRSVKPDKDNDGQYIVKAVEIRDLTHEAVLVTHMDKEKGLSLVRYVNWKVGESDAKGIAASERGNVTGKLAGVTVVDSPSAANGLINIFLDNADFK
jgi:hypothetical protein